MLNPGINKVKTFIFTWTLKSYNQLYENDGLYLIQCLNWSGFDCMQKHLALNSGKSAQNWMLSGRYSEYPLIW